MSCILKCKFTPRLCHITLFRGPKLTFYRGCMPPDPPLHGACTLYSAPPQINLLNPGFASPPPLAKNIPVLEWSLYCCKDHYYHWSCLLTYLLMCFSIVGVMYMYIVDHIVRYFSVYKLSYILCLSMIGVKLELNGELCTG